MASASIPRILVTSRQEIRNSHLSAHTEKAYLDWIFRFLTFQDVQDLNDLTEKEINIFLSFLAVRKQTASATQNQAYHAILFLYRNVLKIRVNHVNFIHVKKRRELPRVFSADEIRKILDNLSGEKKLIVSMLYGCGLNLIECLSLRVRDIDFELNIIHVRNHRTRKARELFIPNKLRGELQSRVDMLHYRYMHLLLTRDYGVTVPGPVMESSPEKCQLFSWFYLFPAVKPLRKSKNGLILYHHRSETFVQKSVRKILKEQMIGANHSCRSFRHSYAIHLLKQGIDIYELQKLLGHENIRNTLTYRSTLKLQSQISGSPLDNL